MQGGHRWMYYATGLPGWMRFGFSPGWVGRSPSGLGPCASYLMTGSWPTPQAQEYWQAAQSGQAPYPYYGGMTPPAFGAGFAQGAPFPGAGFAPGLSKEQELDMLKSQAEMLNQQMEQINNRITELEKEDSKKEDSE